MRSSLRVVAICSAALFAPLFIPLATGRVFTLDDLGAYHIPFRYLYSAALHTGNLMLWTPAVFAGYYVFGEGQIGMAHPWHLLLYRFLPLAVAFNVEIISSYVAMFAGVVLLLKRLRLSTESRWFGAMVFTFSSYNLFHLIHVNIIAAVAHIPWILVLTHTLVVASGRRTRAWAFIAMTLIVASQILVGHTQHVWFGLLLVGGLCGYFVWSGVSLARVALVPLALAIGALVAGVQLLPLFDVVASSQRTDWVPDFSLSFSLSPANVVQLWSPFAFKGVIRATTLERYATHEFIVYNGAFCTVTLAWLGVRWSALGRKHVVRGLLVLAVVALIFSLGRYGGIYAWLVTLPGLRWFRAPTRHLMLLQLSLSVLAAIVFEDVVNLVKRRELIPFRRLWPLAIPCVLSAGTIVAASIAIAAGHGEPLSGIATTAPWLMLFVLVAFLFAAAGRGARWAVPLLVVVTACDQGYFGFHYVFGNPFRPLMTIDELARRPETPEGAHPGDLIVMNWEEGYHNVPILRGLRVWPGYVGLVPALQLQYSETSARLAGAKWNVTEAGIEPIQDPASRARLLTTVKVSTNLSADVQAINILEEALVDASIDDLSGPSGSVRLLEDRPGRIVVETTAPGRQLLILTERFDAGWQGTDAVIQGTAPASDLASVRPLRVYGDFLGYVVGPGTHRVTFRFQPKSFDRGLWVTVFGLLMVLCAMPFAFIGTRKTP